MMTRLIFFLTLPITIIPLFLMFCFVAWAIGRQEKARRQQIIDNLSQN